VSAEVIPLAWTGGLIAATMLVLRLIFPAGHRGANILHGAGAVAGLGVLALGVLADRAAGGAWLLLLAAAFAAQDATRGRDALDRLVAGAVPGLLAVCCLALVPFAVRLLPAGWAFAGAAILGPAAILAAMTARGWRAAAPTAATVFCFGFFIHLGAGLTGPPVCLAAGTICLSSGPAAPIPLELPAMILLAAFTRPQSGTPPPSAGRNSTIMDG